VKKVPLEFCAAVAWSEAHMRKLVLDKDFRLAYDLKLADYHEHLRRWN
jgi:hypothetical protein